MNRKLYNELKAKVESLEKQINGGKGSGNFGHSGRPGKKGGSAPQGTTPFKAGDTYKKDGETFTVEDDGRGGLQGVADGGNIVSEVPSKKGVEEAKKYLKQVQDAIEDNIIRASQAAMAAKEEGKDVAEYTTELHEERKELRERAARLQSRIDSYESALRRKEHEEKIGKIIGTEKIRQGQDKKTDDANYKKLEKDIREIQKVLAKEPSRENFGQDEVRKLKDKYSDYMSGNWSVVGKFISLIQDFDRWASERPWGNAFTATPEQLAKTLNGGKGSGNFGHAGRPGERGGSAPEGVVPAEQEEPKGVKGGTKAEHEAIMEKVASYAADEDEGLDGIFRDVEAASNPHEDHTNYQKAKRWLEAGGGAVSYYGAYEELKDLYGDNFKPETYLAKGGSPDNGDWKYKDGQPYVWSIYLAKFAKAIADEMDKRENMNKNFYKELIAKIDNLAETIVKNGGKGSGNFGHAGRPGKIGGSAPEGTTTGSTTDGGDKKTGSEKGALESVHTDARGKYGDGFDILEDAKEYLVEKARDPYGGGLGEAIALAYEDDARDFLGLPSHEEEDEGAEMAYSDFVDLQDRLEEVIREKSWEDLENDLGAINTEDAINFGLDKSGYKFATENAKLGQAGLSHDDAVRDLKSFIADFGISDHYGAIKAAEDGDLKTAWTNISYDMRDKLKDEYDYDPLREEYD